MKHANLIKKRRIAWAVAGSLLLTLACGSKGPLRWKHGTKMPNCTLKISDFSKGKLMECEEVRGEIHYSLAGLPPNGWWWQIKVRAEITGPIDYVWDLPGDDFNMDWYEDDHKWIGEANLASNKTSGVTICRIYATSVDQDTNGSVSVSLTYGWSWPNPNPPPPVKSDSETIADSYNFTVGDSNGKKSSSQGQGGVTIETDDYSGFEAWSGLTEIPSTLTINVPHGTKISNVVVTAKIETNADVLAQPYADDPPGDFQMSWTKLSGNPKWGWQGTASLGTLNANKESHILVDVGTVSQSETATVQAQVEYDYQGQHETLQVSYNVGLIP